MFMSLGFLFRTQLTALAHIATAAGRTMLAVAVGVAIAVFILWKYRQRTHFRRQMLTRTISPQELKDLIDRGRPPTIIDVRHPLDLLAVPFTIPGAVRIPLESLATQASSVPRGQEIVIYCTCPNQASSSRALQLLRGKGLTQLRVLAGGFQAWRDRGFEIRKFQFDATETKTLSAIWAF
jgi:rhodanese-related sulfurtransferase